MDSALMIDFFVVCLKGRLRAAGPLGHGQIYSYIERPSARCASRRRISRQILVTIQNRLERLTSSAVSFFTPFTISRYASRPKHPSSAPSPRLSRLSHVSTQAS